MPRIIAGKYKGLRLISPAGLETRPTADQVKEAMFSMLESLPFSFQGARVLDFFAGSGALGLEALSRGAAYALFCDHSPKALEAVRRNLATIKTPPEAAVMKISWPGGLRKQFSEPRPFNLFLLDPPYQAQTLPLTLLKEVLTSGLAAPGSVALWEQSPDTLKTWTEDQLRPWLVVKDRTWGKKAAVILCAPK